MRKRLWPITLVLFAVCLFALMPQKVEAAQTDRYGYAMLETDQQKALYVLIADAMAECKEELSLSGMNYTQSDLLAAEQMVRRDFPEFFYYYQCSYSITQYGYVHSLTLHYALDGQLVAGDSAVLKAAIAAVDEQVSEITKNVQGTDYEKALYLHDYIVTNTAYINTPNDQTAYGALIDNKAVCAGYTHAYQLLLREVGVESFYITGMSKGMPHAWLLVFLNGDCYYTDVTWDDPLTQDGSNVLGHYYFDMSFDDISRDHTFDDVYYDWLPEKHDHHELYYYEHEAKEGSGVGWFNSDTDPKEFYKYLKKVGNTYVCDFRFDGNDSSEWLGEAVNAAAYQVGATSASVRQIGSEYIVTLNVPAPAIIASGNCGAQGDNLTWTLDEEGTLTISGTGAMEDYHSYSDVPWYSNCNSIKKVVIGNSVTSIGDYAFQYCDRLTSITIPDSVTSIGDDVFYNCTNLTSITIPDGVTSIGSYAFCNCASLKSITIPQSVTSIGNSAFYNCTSLTDVHYGGSKAQWNEITVGSYNEDLTNATIHYGKVSGPQEDPNAKFASTGLSLGEFIGLQSALMKSAINSGEFDEAYFMYKHHTFDEDGNAIVNEAKGEYLDMGSYFVADCKVNAKQMSDVFEITPYYVVDGVTYYGATTTTSVKAESMKKINDAKTDSKIKALCAAMLNYGAEAQKNFGYNQGSLANSELSAAQKVLPAFADLNLEKTNTIPTTPYKPASSGMSLGDVVYMQFLMPMSKVDADGSMKYQIIGEDPVEVAIADLETYGDTYYIINIPIKAKHVRTNIAIALFNAQGTRDYGYMVCSIEAFTVAKQGTSTETLATALMAYGDAAKAVFG